MEQSYSENQPKRPVFLKVLCILTFICTGLNLLILLMSLAQGSPSAEQIQLEETRTLESIASLRAQGLDEVAQLMERIANMSTYTNAMPYTMIMLNILTTALGLLGAVFMWQGKKLGFHMYILYSLAAISVIYVAVPFREVPLLFPVSNMIISGAFILMYSRNLKWMK